MAINLGDFYNPISPIDYTDKIYIELNAKIFNSSNIEYVTNIHTIQSLNEYFFPTTGDIMYTDRILEHFNGYFVTGQGDKGFENGLLVGMMLANSGII